MPFLQQFFTLAKNVNGLNQVELNLKRILLKIWPQILAQHSNSESELPAVLHLCEIILFCLLVVSVSKCVSAKKKGTLSTLLPWA